MTPQPPATPCDADGAIVTSVTAALTLLGASAASAAPTFRVPFPCGQTILQGQPIGSVGNSSYRNITPHLHFEIRLGAGYPANIRAVPGYNYAKVGSQSMKSTNCATRQDPATLCGKGYVVNDTAKLGSAGAVVLTYDKVAKNNCAVTLKFGNLGSRTAANVYITPEGQTKKSDSGKFFEYAGPIRTNSPTCIKWGGAIGGSSYNSPSEHC